MLENDYEYAILSNQENEFDMCSSLLTLIHN